MVGSPASRTAHGADGRDQSPVRRLRPRARRRPGSAQARAGPSSVDSGWWRWGESNPRPSLGLHAFSGRSLRIRSARLRPLSQTPKSTSPAWEKSRTASRRRRAARSLDDARNRVGITHGLTDYRARCSGSEGEVSALGVGTYGCAGSVDEITLHPRPASRGFAGDVETDHPRACSVGAAAVALWSCSSDAAASEHTSIQRMPPPAHSRHRGRRPPVGSRYERCRHHRPRRAGAIGRS